MQGVGLNVDTGKREFINPLNFYYNLTGLALPPNGSAIMEGGEGVLRPSGDHTPNRSRVDTRRYKYTSKHASHS